MLGQQRARHCAKRGSDANVCGGHTLLVGRWEGRKKCPRFCQMYALRPEVFLLPYIFNCLTYALWHPRGRLGICDVSPHLESQGCVLISPFYLSSCCSALSCRSFCVFFFLLLAHFPTYLQKFVLNFFLEMGPYLYCFQRLLRQVGTSEAPILPLCCVWRKWSRLNQKVEKGRN